MSYVGSGPAHGQVLVLCPALKCWGGVAYQPSPCVGHLYVGPLLSVVAELVDARVPVRNMPIYGSFLMFSLELRRYGAPELSGVR